MAGPATDPSGETVLQSARAGEPDRYLSALLAPAAARPHLIALAAFSAELARVASAVRREPMMGEVRLQWWDDTLGGDSAGGSGHPVADALRATIAGCGLPSELVHDLVHARALDLAAEPLETEADLASYLWRTEGIAFELAARVLAGPAGPEVRTAAEAGGQSYGLARLLLALPHALARGRQPLPRSSLQAAGLDAPALLAGEGGERLAPVLTGLNASARASLARARDAVAKLPLEMRPAFLPLALVETYLRALERPGRDVLRTPADIAPLTRLWRIAAARWLGRL